MNLGGKQRRAHEPDEAGFIERDKTRVYWERYGDSGPPILFLPTWSIIHSRMWKGQLPYFGRRCRAVTFDPRGNGRSDRPADPSAYAETEFAADALALMDASGTERAFLVAPSLVAQRALLLAADQPERVREIVSIGATLPLSPSNPGQSEDPPDVPLQTSEGSQKFNFHYCQQDFRDFLEFFFAQVFPEPHSTKQIEDCVTWGLHTTPETLVATVAVGWMESEDEALDLCARVRCPVLVVHGTDDRLQPHDRGRRLAEETGGELATIEGGGHSPQARDPVRFNLLLRGFVAPGATGTSSFTGGGSGRRRALFVSSPIGLGHARRDVAIARELRALVPGLEIDWLAQDPVTRVLEGEGERIHPASEHLASESAHFQSESTEHDLHCFHAWRRMDEILIANFMLFHDVVSEEPYELWLADEAWDVDYFLHENPELKNAHYIWLTDFVGFLPMDDADDYERYLAEDYNAQMVEHIAEHPGLRDRSLFVGNPDDIVPERLGKDLPKIREWTEQHFDFPGYISGFDPADLAERQALRAELGYSKAEKVCIVSVGGSGVGVSLLRRVIDSYPAAKERVPELRMIVVAGPRIDPASLPAVDGVEVRAYVHDLYKHFAACDVAVVQGGLTTAMELTANRRPFLYFPLKHHFEQRIHVAARLDRHAAGRRMEYDDSSPELIAQAIAEEVGREVDYRPVEADGARRAAERIAELL